MLMPPRASHAATAAIASLLLRVGAAVATPEAAMTTSATVFGSGMAAIMSVLQIGAATLTIMLLLLLVLVYVQPRWFMRFMAWASHPSVLWCVNTSARVCSLTIDDAPSASTPLILDTLKQHNVKATFFIISDRIAGNEEVMRRIVREGHTLGNHLTEDRASVFDALHVFEQKLQECDRAIRAYQPDVPAAVPLAAVVDEVRKIETETTKLLSDSNGTPSTSNGSSSATPMRWLRPASGWFTSSMREVIQTNGYRICLGSVYPHDAQIKFEFLNALHLRTFTGNGSVIIVHDRQWTVGVLQAALPALTKELRFVSLNELVQHE